MLYSNGVFNTDQSSNEDPSSVNLLAVLLGTGLVAIVVGVASVVVLVAIVYRRRRQSVSNMRISVGVSMDTEKTRLIFQQ